MEIILLQNVKIVSWILVQTGAWTMVIAFGTKQNIDWNLNCDEVSQKIVLLLNIVVAAKKR